jgi:hypothetical protein
MDENTTNGVAVDLGLKDQLAITILTGIVGLVSSKLVEKTYVGVKTKVVQHRAAASQQ